jgi:hypothetical protein
LRRRSTLCSAVFLGAVAPVAFAGVMPLVLSHPAILLHFTMMTCMLQHVWDIFFLEGPKILFRWRVPSHLSTVSLFSSFLESLCL